LIWSFSVLVRFARVRQPRLLDRIFFGEVEWTKTISFPDLQNCTYDDAHALREQYFRLDARGDRRVLKSLLMLLAICAVIFSRICGRLR
jgi:hypothetical protein